MRVILRLLSAGFLALAMILLIGDGTAMLANNAYVATPLAQTMVQLFPDAFPAARAAIEENVHPLLWEPAITTFLSWPGWAVFGAAGAALAVMGRSRSRRRLVSIDQY